MARSARGNDDSHVGRVFGLLDLIGAEPEPLTLSELARRAELPVSTVHRLLGELVAWGGIERTESGTYRLGNKIWRLGVASSWERRLRGLALPYARELSHRTGAAVAISAMVGDRLICLDTIRGRNDVIYLAQAGDDLPLFATSAGKLLMATVDRKVLVNALRTRLVRRTPYTQVMPKLVLDQLDRAREAGFAMSHSESTLGQSSMSVRVRTSGPDDIAMALTLLTSAAPRELTRHVPVLRSAATSMGRAIATG